MDTYLSDGGFSEIPDVVMKRGRRPPPPRPRRPRRTKWLPVMPPEPASMKDVYNKAVEATRAGNLDEAEKLYKEILEKLPNLAEIHYNLGRVYVAKNDLDSAEASFRRVVELQPEKRRRLHRPGRPARRERQDPGGGRPPASRPARLSKATRSSSSCSARLA